MAMRKLMTVKRPNTNHELARKKALQTLLAKTNSTVEDKIAALKTVHAVDATKVSAALSDMMKKN